MGLYTYFLLGIAALLVLHNVLYWPSSTGSASPLRARALPPETPAREARSLAAAHEADAGALARTLTAGAVGSPSADPAVPVVRALPAGMPPPRISKECTPRLPETPLYRPLQPLPRRLGECGGGAAGELCAAAARVERDSTVILVPISEGTLAEWAEFSQAARAVGAAHVVALVVEPSAGEEGGARVVAEARARASVGEVVRWSAALAPPSAAGYAASPPTDAAHTLLGGAAAFDGARVLLSAGVRVQLADVGVVLRADPLVHAWRDHDVEAHQPAGAEYTKGRVVSVMDASMGWSRFAQSLAVPHLAADWVALAPTAEAVALAARLSARLRGVGHAAAARRADIPDERSLALEWALTAEALTPSHDAWRSVGVSVRMLPPRCYAQLVGGTLGGRFSGSIPSVVAAVPPGAERRAAVMASVRDSGTLPLLASLPPAPRAREDPNRLLTSAVHDTTPAVVKAQCEAELPPARAETRAQAAADDAAAEAAGAPRRARPLNYILPASAPFPPPAACVAHGLQELCALLRTVVAPRREALVAVSNKNIFHMLQLYIDGVKRAKVSNALVVALDDETHAWLSERSFPSYVRKVQARGGSTDNHATSGLKFRILREFMLVGCSVLLSDVDVAWMRDPFPALYGDADVEGMTDGFDDLSSYGAPGSGVLGGSSWRIFARNSGMFYISATNESLRMMERMTHRMATESIWDQTAYNEEQFYLTTETFQGLGLSQRVMNYLCFLNTKVLFKYVRETAELYPDAYTPIGAHVNYHPEKPQRMADIFKHYQQGQRGVLERWNGGEGLKISNDCKFDGVRPDSSKGRGSALLAAVLARGKGEWGGVRWLRFDADGKLGTPWGEGTWGGAPADRSETTIWCDFFGKTRHLLRLSGTLPADDAAPIELTSTRCTDGDTVKVKVMRGESS